MKARVCFEGTLLALIIISVWTIMFLPVVIYFLPLRSNTEQPATGNGSDSPHLSKMMTVDSTCLRNNMNNYSSTNILIQNIVCSEDFFLNDDAFCRPKCQSWLMFSRTAETASLAIIGSATVIGILTTVVIIILSFVHYRKMLTFPSVLILYQDITVSIYGIVVLIGFMDRTIFCTSDDLIKTYNSFASPFCNLSGFLSSFAVLPLAIWIAVQIGYILAAISAPFYFNRLKETKWKVNVLHITALLVGVLSPLVPSIASIASQGGFTSFDTKFPPIVCFTRNRDITVYSLLIPLAVLISLIITQLILIIHFLLRKRCINKNKSKVLQNAEIKMLIICCYYVVLGLGASLAYVISSVNLRGLKIELSEYFECECLGVNFNQTCDISGYKGYINPPMLTIGYSLLALYPVITLMYILRLSALHDLIMTACNRCSYLKIFNGSINSSSG